jgi:hypothetical protein
LTSLAASDKGPKSTPDDPKEERLLEREISAKQETLHKLKQENDRKDEEMQCLWLKVGVLQSLVQEKQHDTVEQGLKFIAQTLKVLGASSSQEKKQ